MENKKLISTAEDLYNFILEKKLNTTQVNQILDSFLITKAMFIFDYHTSLQIVDFLKEFFKTNNKRIFIDYDFDNFDIKDFYSEENNLLQFKE